MSLAPDRDQYRNASDAPAMLGISPYETRQALLERVKYGVQKTITPAVQDIFDSGHRIEALARPIAEALLGHTLPPKRSTKGNLGATLDGYFCSDELEGVNWECKTLNDAIRECFPISAAGITHGVVELPEYLCAQMEQQLMCSEADMCLFTAHKDGETVHCWYYPDAIMRQRIVDGWAQFERDLSAMPELLPVKAFEGQLMPVVRSFPQLPALQFGLVTGKAEALKQFEQDSRQFVQTINQDLQTDQDFSDGESDKKELVECVARLDSLINAPVDLATLKRIRELFNTARLNLEKQLAERKQTRKNDLVRNAKTHYRLTVSQLELPEYISAESVDFTAAVKGMSSLASMRNALDAAFLKAQSEVNLLAVKIRKNLALIAAADAPLLFPNLRDLVTKTPEDLQNHISVTLAKFKEAQDEAERKKALLAVESEKIAGGVIIPELPESDACSGLCEPDCPALLTVAQANERVLIGSISIPRHESMRTLNIGQINERLRVVSVTRAQLTELGFPGVEGKVKGRFEWLESDYPRITAKIKTNI